MNAVPAFNVRILITIIFLVLLASTVEACDKDPECGDPTAWASFTRISLKQSSQGSPEIVEWQGLFDHETNDMLIKIKSSGSDSSMNGSIGLVNGRIMLTKGLDLKPGYEIDAIDVPVLSMKLAMIILGRIFPDGPKEIAGNKVIDHTDNTGIKFATPSASGYISAPWRVNGSINKDADGNVDYELNLTLQAGTKEDKNKSYSISMEGQMGMHKPPIFQDSDSLSGWKTYGLGPRQFKQGKSTVLDYGATPGKNDDYKNIGDIRAFIAAENHPGHKDDTKDFTGFWKEKCNQAFGLQIMHQGDEGKYSVVFCGPGGCGDPSEDRLTFITGDKHWEVISEDELVQVSRSGKKETYHRCTKDTHPVLKYKK